MNSVTHYILTGDERKGPFTIGQLQAMWNSGQVTSETQHWMDGYSEWLPLDFIREDLEQKTLPRLTRATGPSQSLVIAKSRGIYILLGLFFFGLLGAHNFYAGRYTPAIIQLVIIVLFWWLVLPIFAVAIWVIIECITVTRDGAGHPMS